MSYEPTFLEGIAVLFLLIVILFGAVFLQAWLFMFLWNMVMPYLFGLPSVNFVTSLCATVLLSIVGSFFKTSVSQ